MATTRLGVYGGPIFGGTFAPKSWAISQAFNRDIANPLPRRRIPRKPHLVPFWMPDADFDNTPIRVAPAIAQPAKLSIGLLGQSRFAESLSGSWGGTKERRAQRNPQRFAGTSDWCGEGITIGSGRKLQSHTSMQIVTATSAASTPTTITAGLVLCNPSTFGLNLTLPDASTWTSDVTVKNRTDYTSTIRVFGYSIAQRIDGAVSAEIDKGFDWLTFRPDGHHWWIVG